jgi:hypothetical protein
MTSLEGTAMLHEQNITAATVADGKRVAEERTFKSHDGTEIFYRYWPAVG